MEFECPSLPLAELCDAERGITYGIVKVGDFIPNGVPVIRGGDIRDGKIVFDDKKRVSEEVSQQFSRTILKGGEIVLNLIAEPGHNAIVPASYCGFNVSRDVAVIPLNDSINHKYVDYFLKSPICVSWLFNRLQGSVTQKINLSVLKELPVPIVSAYRQKAIAHILGSLDDKIELNRQMNATLEAIAQALFKSWFVDFDPVIDNALAAGNPIPEPLQARAEARKALGEQRKPLPEEIQKQFPSAFEYDEELGWVPKGWESHNIENILERLRISKRYKKKDVSSFGLVPVYEQGADILLGFHDNEPDIAATSNKPAFIFGDHTCVTKLSIEPFSISENVIALKGRCFDTTWVYYAVAGKQKFEEYRRHWMELIVKQVITPAPSLADEFAQSVKPSLLKQTELLHEIRILGRLRDTLLPNLLSGELRISDAEKLVAEAL